MEKKIFYKNIKRNKNKIFILFGIVSALFLFLLFLKNEKQIQVSLYPDGKNFAFTITDDPDGNSVEKIKPVYELLLENGFKTTMAVWAKESIYSNGFPEKSGLFDYGDTLQQKPYLDLVKKLHGEGFEIALHTVSGGNDYREYTKEGYEEFKQLFGYYPKINIMHSNNLEDIYWGKNIFNNNLVQQIMEIFLSKGRLPFSGEDEGSPYFWGDIAKEKTRYIRLWGTSNINTLSFNPSMPYHDPRKPYVNYWFSFSDGYDAKFFNELLTDKNIEKLVKERGVCIAYTHFADGFTVKRDDGQYVVNDTTKIQLKKLSKQKDGWFVPASEILDRLLAMKKVVVHDRGDVMLISNYNDFPVPGITLLTKAGMILYGYSGTAYQANMEGEILIGTLDAGETFTLFTSMNNKYIRDHRVGAVENFRLFYERLKILLFSHYG